MRRVERRSAARRPAGNDARQQPHLAPVGDETALPVSVVVPTRNVAGWVEACLVAIRANHPAEIIVVDGSSRDGTTSLAARLADVMIDDAGSGVSAARRLGFELSSQPWVAFIDADVLVEPDTLRRMLEEAQRGGLDGLQAALRSVGAGDYWSEALARHHNRGRSRRWFGVCATLLRREAMEQVPFDPALRSGEDVDLRLRMAGAGMRIGVSTAVEVGHRFGDGFGFARRQWFADGAGLGRIVRKHGVRALPLAVLPFGASAFGLARVLVGETLDVPYWIGLAVGNLLGLLAGLLDRRVPLGPDGTLLPAAAETRKTGDDRHNAVTDTDEPRAPARRALPADLSARRAQRARRLGYGRPEPVVQIGPASSGPPPAGEQAVPGEARPSRQAGEVTVAAVLGLLVAATVLVALGCLATIFGLLPRLGSALDSSRIPVTATVLTAAVLIAAEIGGAGTVPAIRRTADRIMPLALGAALVVLVVSGIRFAYIVGLLG